MKKLRELYLAFRYIPSLFRLVWRTDKRYLLYTICETLCFAILPYPTLLLVKYAIDAMSLQMEFPKYAGICIFLLIVDLVIISAKSFFNTLRPNRTMIMNGRLFNQFHKKSMELDYQLLAEKEIQELQSLASEFVSNRLGMKIWNFIWLFSGLISFSISFTLLISIDVWLILIVCANMMLNTGIPAKFVPFNNKFQNKVILLNRKIEYFDKIATDYSNAKDIRIFQIGKNFGRRTIIFIKNIYAVYRKQAMVSNLQQGMSIGAFSLLVSNISILRQYMNQISSTLIEYSETAKFVEYFNRFMALESRFRVTGTRLVKLSKEEPYQIEFRHVSFQYPGQKVGYTSSKI